MFDDELGKIEFYNQPVKGGPEVRMTLHPHIPLPEILGQFELFLKAIGYCFVGEVDIINEDTEAEVIRELMRGEPDV